MFKTFALFGLLLTTLPACGSGGAPATTSETGPLPEAASVNVDANNSALVQLRPARQHDFTRADTLGTLQFVVTQGTSERVTQALSSALHYVSDAGTSVAAAVDVPKAKGDAPQIAVVQSAQPLAEDTWYTVKLDPISGLHIPGIADNAAWSVRLYTGSDPRLVAVKVTPKGVELEMSEPVNWAKLETRLATANGRVAACMETAAGCVEAPAEDLMDETATLRVEEPPSLSRLDVAVLSRGAKINAELTSVSLSAADFRAGAVSGTNVWRRKSGE
ncbi:MAG TPA: hypothetical protein VNG33_06255 [Polyangiaceae bacterium]|nr:hypothetical protein [Polyangiaceae bacterium]